MANSEHTQHNSEPQGKRGTDAGLMPTNNPSGGPINGKSGAATATVRSFYDQAKETAGQAYEAVTDTAANKLDERKSTISEGLSTVADSVRRVSDNLETSTTGGGALAETASKYTKTAARKIEDVAGYLDTRSVRDMAEDLQQFARRNPAIFIGAAFGLGFLAARFLKSSPPNYNEARAGREYATSATVDRQPKPGLPSGSDMPDLEARPL